VWFHGRRLRSAGPVRRRQAADALARLPGCRAADRLADALADADGTVREAVQRALAGMGSAAVEPLRRSLRHSDTRVCRAATRVVVLLKDVGLVPDLLKLVKVGGREQRRWAARALIELGPPALDPLRLALEDDDVFVQKEAARIIEAIQENASLVKE
jgi:HEAT repeat protein